MADMLNTAISGLLTYQRALSTTSHNIANVSTKGYSKQNVDINTNTPTLQGGRLVGNGSHIDSVTRSYDQFLTSEVRDTTSSFSKLDLMYDLSGYVDNVLGDPYGGISPGIQDFFSGVNDVSDDPTSTTARNNLINVSKSLVDRFHNIDTRFSELEANASRDVEVVVDEINSIVSQIADINLRLNNISIDATDPAQSADFLDTRDRLLLDLAERVDITVVNEDKSFLSIFVGSGQSILTGTTQFDLSAITSDVDPSLDSIVYSDLGSSRDLSASLNTGGQLGALLSFRDEVLFDARNDLGRVAIAIADVFNEHHVQGMDLNNNLGTNFFSYADPKILHNTNNTGTADVSATITEASQLTRFDYDLDYDGTNWVLTSDSGTSSTTVDASPADTVIAFEGFEITIAAASTAVAGDTFRIRPTINGAASINVEIEDPLLIAAAAAVKTSKSLNNLGTTAISQGVVTDGTNANLLDTVSFVFDDPATTLTASADVVVNGATILAGAAISYTNNMTLAANGWTVNLSGVPAANDQLTVEANIDGQGDNRNALILGELQTDFTMDGGNSSFQDAYSGLIGRVGTITAATEIQRDAQESLLIQSQERKDSKTAVNLDEEAADLVRYQQAYQASSQIISVVQRMFDTLLSSL